MNFFKKYKKIIMILGLLIIVAIAYTVVVDKTDDSLLVSESSIDANSVLQNELLALLLEIRAIKLDESILSDTAFRGLKDFGQEIVSEPVGRNDPFAPVGFIAIPETIEEEAE